VFIAVLALTWILINLAYRAYLYKYPSISVKYGVLLVVKKSRAIKPSSVIRKVSVLWTALYVFALVLAVYTTIMSAYTRFTQKEPSVVILVPGISITGVDLVFVLIAVCIAASVHEYLHAKVAVSSNIKVKGFGVLVALLLPLAFVELDESSFESASKSSKIKVLAAGIAGNIILYFAASLVLLGLVQSAGILVTSVDSNSLAEKCGIKPYDVILAVNGTEITSISVLREYMSIPENTTLEFTVWRFNTGLKNITVFKPANTTLLGIRASVTPRLVLAEVLTPHIAFYVVIFTIWLSIVNFSLALINALPLYITDGGRIANITLGKRGGVIANSLGVALLALLLMSSRI